MVPHEALKTFNCGIGMVLVVDPQHVNSISDVLTRQGEVVYPIGGIVMRGDDKDPQVVISNESVLKA